MKRSVVLFVLSVAAAVLASSCGTQGGGTQQDVGDLRRLRCCHRG